MEKKDKVGRGCFEPKVHWRKARVQGNGFSLAELWGV